MEYERQRAYDLLTGKEEGLKEGRSEAKLAQTMDSSLDSEWLMVI